MKNLEYIAYRMYTIHHAEQNCLSIKIMLKLFKSFAHPKIKQKLYIGELIKTQIDNLVPEFHRLDSCLFDSNRNSTSTARKIISKNVIRLHVDKYFSSPTKLSRGEASKEQDDWHVSITIQL